MSNDIAIPAFHGRSRTPEYYQKITSIIRAGGRITTLRAHADKLNSMGLTTPTGLPWNKHRVKNYITNTNLTYF